MVPDALLAEAESLLAACRAKRVLLAGVRAAVAQALAMICARI
jgi:hypothetical protein